VARLSKVKSWMTFYGWTLGGGPGSVKHDADGKVIAAHGDSVWNSDVNMALIRDDRDEQNDKLMDEIAASGGAF